jgi:integrase
MIRDALILTWAELSGARRKEVLMLTVAQIPSWDRIRVLEESDEEFGILILGKGNKKRWLWVGAEVLSQTREYMENERAAIVKRWQKRNACYKAPEHIFLSTKTGRRLLEDSVSQRFAIVFLKAGVKGSMHRVRARYLTDLVFNAVESALEKYGAIPDAMSILLPIAERAGHTHVPTMAPYLAAGQKRLLRMTESERSAMATEKAIAVEHRLSTNRARLKSSLALLDLDSAIASGSKKRIREAIIAICETHRVNLSSPKVRERRPRPKEYHSHAAP